MRAADTMSVAFMAAAAQEWSPASWRQSRLSSIAARRQVIDRQLAFASLVAGDHGGAVGAESEVCWSQE